MLDKRASFNTAVALSPDGGVMIFSSAIELFHSDDGRASYGRALCIGRVLCDIAFAPSNPTVVYAASRGYDVYKSTDGGRSFTALPSPRARLE